MNSNDVILVNLARFRCANYGGGISAFGNVPHLGRRMRDDI
jgi:hypothetical protein